VTWGHWYEIRSYLRSAVWTAPVIALALQQATFRIASAHQLDFGPIPGFVYSREGAIAIADYVAMLTLSQTDAFATCRQMPSITNLLMPDCDASLKTEGLSDADLAFLRGVYKTKGGDNLNLAMGDIFREMEKSSAVRALADAAAERTGSTVPPPLAK